MPKGAHRGFADRRVSSTDREVRLSAWRAAGAQQPARGQQQTGRMGWKRVLHGLLKPGGGCRRHCCPLRQRGQQPMVRRCAGHAQCCAKRQLVRSLGSAPLALARRPLRSLAPPQQEPQGLPQRPRAPNLQAVPQEWSAVGPVPWQPAPAPAAARPAPAAAQVRPFAAAQTAAQAPLLAQSLVPTGAAAQAPAPAVPRRAAPVEPRRFRPTWEGSRSGGTSVGILSRGRAGKGGRQQESSSAQVTAQTCLICTLEAPTCGGPPANSGCSSGLPASPIKPT